MSVLSWDEGFVGLMSLKLNSNVLFYTVNGNDSMDLSELYTIKAGPLISREVGTWDRSTGLMISEPNIWERRSNLGGVSMKTCVTNGSTFIMRVSLDSEEAQAHWHFASFLILFCSCNWLKG